jgi:dihydrodipicolinate synthase/N-acetylneuraminate lyase
MLDIVRAAFAPVPTPVGEDGGFEPSALSRHLRWIADGGVDGALVLGTNGEFPSFSLDERHRVAETAAAAGSNARLLLGVGSCAVVEAVKMARLAGRLGYEAVLCPPPFYYRGAPVGGIADFFRAVLDASPLPVLLYHIPQVTGVPISDELLDAIGDHGRLAGVKDSSGDPREMARLAARFSDGCYMVGSDRLVAAALEAGGAGSISAAASVVPKLVAAVNRGVDRQHELTAIRSLLEEFGLGPAVKCILRDWGFGSYRTRPPLLGLDEARERDLLRRFSEFNVEYPDRG